MIHELNHRVKIRSPRAGDRIGDVYTTRAVHARRRWEAGYCAGPVHDVLTREAWRGLTCTR